MSVQLRTDQNSTAKTDLPRSSSIAELSGTNREVRRIQIDDPNALNAEILKYKEEPEENRLLSIAMLVAFAAVAVLAIGSAIFLSPVMAPVILVLGWVLISVPVEYRTRQDLGSRQQQVLELEACQRSMAAEPSFREFARTYFGEAFSIEQLLKVHYLFQTNQTLKNSLSQFSQDMLRLSDEISPGRTGEPGMSYFAFMGV